VDPDSRQIGIAASATLPAVRGSGLSEEIFLGYVIPVVFVCKTDKQERNSL